MKEIKNPKRPLVYYAVVAMLAVLLFNLLAVPAMANAAVKEVDYGTFMDMTEKGDIGKVEIETNQIIFTDKSGQSFYKTGLMDDPDRTERLYKAGAEFSSEIVEQTSPLLSFVLTWVLPILIFVWIGDVMSKKMMNGGPNSLMFNMGGSSAKVYVKSADGIRFDDVAGEEEAKENLTEIVEYLHNPEKYREVGANMPKGVLLVGPPGTGKTMLAKAVAGEANVPFFSMSGSEFVEMFVGMGASKVRDLFKQAKEKAPCIVFIDEIDAIGKKRQGNVMGNDEREQTLNQLLTEMDGFESNNGVIILAATNQPDALDPALTRPGRFDRRVPVELPDLKGREEILKVHAKKIKLADNVDFNKIARMASGALGYTMQVDEGNHYLMTKDELINKIATLTGGRAAEELIFGSITTGASNDIEQATKLARAMITRYGMSEEFDMVALETVTNQYLGGDTSLACSADTQREIDRKVVELVKSQHEKALKILTDNREKLDELAKHLYEKETITGEEFMSILNG